MRFLCIFISVMLQNCFPAHSVMPQLLFHLLYLLIAIIGIKLATMYCLCLYYSNHVYLSIAFLEIMLTVTESDGLCVNTASLNMDSFVDFSITSQDLIGTIALENDEISLRVDQEKLE